MRHQNSSFKLPSFILMLCCGTHKIDTPNKVHIVSSFCLHTLYLSFECKSRKFPYEKFYGSRNVCVSVVVAIFIGKQFSVARFFTDCCCYWRSPVISVGIIRKLLEFFVVDIIKVWTRLCAIKCCVGKWPKYKAIVYNLLNANDAFYRRVYLF